MHQIRSIDEASWPNDSEASCSMIVGRVGIVGRLVSKVGRVDKKWGELAVGRVVLLPVCYTPESGQLAPQPNRPQFSTNSPPFPRQLAPLVKKKFPTRPPCEVGNNFFLFGGELSRKGGRVGVGRVNLDFILLCLKVKVGRMKCSNFMIRS